MTAILRSRLLSQFSCLGDRCEDTCCRGWSMQVDAATLGRYRAGAPELLDAVEAGEGGADASPIMRKEAQSGFCVKLEDGLCGIQKTYGDNFLSDACHFYPRVTRSLGGQAVVSATMSCPEIVRLALAEDEPCALEESTVDRLPQSLKEYLPEGLLPEDALAVHRAFLAVAADADVSAEHIFLRIASASRSIERIDKKTWAQAVPYYLRNADARIPAAEINISDPFNLLHALCGLIVASKKKPSERLRQTIADMEGALKVSLDWQQVLINAAPDSLTSYRQLQAMWNDEAAGRYTPLLRRWLQMQLSLSLYPFAGLGSRLSDRITIIGVRLATIKLALMCNCGIHGTIVPQDVVIRIVQSLSRVLDHLGDPDFSLQIYAETGWDKENRMRGLLENSK